jgi:hypothetical protein
MTADPVISQPFRKSTPVDWLKSQEVQKTPEVSKELRKSDCSNAFIRNLSIRSRLLLTLFTYKIFRLFFWLKIHERGVVTLQL